MKIAVDLDDVLNNSQEVLCDFVNLRYNKNLTLEDYTDYTLWKVWGVEREKMFDMIYEFYDSEYFNKVSPLNEAQTALEVLSKNHELFLVTSRSIDLKNKTENWINKNFPNKFKKVILTNSFSKNNLREISKADVCKQENLNLLIDDCYKYVSDCIEKNIPAILMNRNWNKNFKDIKGMVRVNNWSEILQIKL